MKNELENEMNIVSEFETKYLNGNEEKERIKSELEEKIEKLNKMVEDEIVRR